MSAMGSFVSADQVLLWAVNVLIHATVLTAVSLLIARFFRKAAVTRYWVLCLGMLLVLGCPLISAVVQSRGDSLLTLAQPSEETPAATTPTALPAVVNNPSVLERPIVFDSAEMADPLPTLDPINEPARSPEQNATAATPVVAETIAGKRSGNDWLRVVGASGVFIWAVGSMILLIRMAIGWIRMARILKHAKPIENVELQRAFTRACEIAARREPSRGGTLQARSVVPSASRLRERVGRRTAQGIVPATELPVPGLRSDAGNPLRPRLVVSDAVSGPIAAGLRGGTVVLPQSLVEQVDVDTLADVLVHEVAHVARRDQIVVLVQNLLAALYWPHPLVRKLNRELAKAREEVCDNFVLAGTDAPAYSRTLLALAELVQQPSTMQGSVGFFTDRWKLEHRVAGLLDEARDTKTILSKRGWAFVLALMLGLVSAISFGTVTIATAQNTSQESSSEPDSDLKLMTISGFVRGQDDDAIAGAKIWLAVTSHQFNSEPNKENRQGLLRELGSADQLGRFEFVLDEAATQKIRSRPRFAQTQLVATAQGYGLGWMLLEVFEDDPTPSKQRKLLQSRIDEALGDGRFASRSLELRPESQPVRGQLVDLEGNPLPNVKVLAESLSQPDTPKLLNALDKSSAQGLHGAINATGIVRGLARSELQRFIPPVTTDENGEFEIHGIGDDQLVTLVLVADRVDARPLHVLGREMKTVSLPHNKQYPGGTQDMFVGRDFAYAVSPSVPVEGIVTDFDTGEPVANVLVSVERLFRAEGAKLRLDTHHMRAVTDQQGRFRITGMPPGEGHIIEAVPPKSKPYLPAPHEVSLSLEDGEAKSIEIRVKRGVWIEGRISDKESGEPRLAVVDYMALKKNSHVPGIPGVDLKLRLDPVHIHQRYVTDSDGRYRVLALPGPGVLLVTSQMPGYPLAAGAETIEGYHAADRTIPTTPLPVRVSKWHLLKQVAPTTEATSFTSDLVLDSGVSIPGRVLCPDGKNITDLHVLGLTERDQYWSPKYQDKVRLTDRFKVNGYDGKGPRQLFFKAQDETLAGQYRLEGDAPEEIVVKLQPSVRVTGRLIESKTDLPAPRYFLACNECSLGERVPPVKFMIHWCNTDDEGRFEIKGLMAGLSYKMYTLNESNNINKDNNFTIDLTTAEPGNTIELGDVPGPNASDKIDPQSPSAMTTPKAATPGEGATGKDAAKSESQFIRGVVRGTDGNPIRDAMVAVIVSKNTGNSGTTTVTLGETRSNEKGEFQISVAFSDEMLRPRLIARTKDSAIQILNLDFKSLEQNYRVDLAPSVPLRIRLVDLEGQPADNIALDRRDLRNVSTRIAAAPPRLITDAGGNVTIEHVAANEGVLLEIVGSERFAPQTLSINTDEPEERPERDATYRYNVKKAPPNKTVTIPLAPSQPFSGQVFLGDSDRPAVNAVISIWSSQQQEGGSMISLESTTDKLGRFQLNPYPGVRYGIQVYPPKDTAYQSVQLRDLRWSSGKETSAMEIRLPKGSIAGGQVTHAVTGEPISGVYVQYLADATNPNKTSGFIEGWQAAVRTDAQGRFRVTALPGLGTLVAHAGESKPFVMKTMGSREVRLGKPGGTRYYAHAFQKFVSGKGNPTTSLKLQPSSPLLLRLVDPDGNAIERANYTSVLTGSPLTIFYRGSPETVAAGQTVIHGLAPADERRIHVWCEDRKMGATATLIGGNKTQTIMLRPAGSVTMRFVNSAGDPIADQPTARFSSLQFIMTEEQAQTDGKDPKERYRRDTDFDSNFNRKRQDDNPQTDSDGQVTLGNLIPGVKYKIHYPRNGEGDLTEFIVESDQHLDLGDITTDGPEDLR